ncbi:MAG: AraC family transcriptional regulator [Sulfuricurvum sp.]|uniref:AraC family transcriptional regulator n=1 Tax=Sulfuricurvum sp. TaxID=2025608 RepID=UPI00262048FD|nr:AraC family transcriptional regulator [Sulfuricurvum sp.]MDD5161073.1 AraC family transcriptional regulator [Sulfuricurvum sp.]
MMSELSQKLLRIVENEAMDEGINKTVVPYIQFFKASDVSQVLHVVYEPSFFVIVQGAKILTLGDHTYRYDPLSYLISSVHLPVTGQIVEASNSHPFLSIQITFTTEQIYEIIEEYNDLNINDNCEASLGLCMEPITTEMLEIIYRQLSLINSPKDIKMLAPLYHKELLYRVLQQGSATALRQFASAQSNAGRISKAIRFMQNDLFEPIHIQELADVAGMSVSSFHKYFKDITSMSPIQYRKQNRLQEARRLMIAKQINASTAAFEVGYESASQFSREYAKYFGLPPSQDIKKIKQALI